MRLSGLLTASRHHRDPTRTTLRHQSLCNHLAVGDLDVLNDLLAERRLEVAPCELGRVGDNQVAIDETGAVIEQRLVPASPR
jgi:hypothetical protein